MLSRISIFIFFLICSALGFCQSAIDTALLKKVQAAVNKISVDAPSQEDPVSVNAGLVWNTNKTQLAIVLKADLLPGWHIYAFVPETEPYIEAKITDEVPKGFTPISEWNLPKTFPDEDGILIFKGELVFIRYFSAGKHELTADINAGLYFQACDINRCLRPQSRIIKLKI